MIWKVSQSYELWFIFYIFFKKRSKWLACKRLRHRECLAWIELNKKCTVWGHFLYVFLCVLMNMIQYKKSHKTFDKCLFKEKMHIKSVDCFFHRDTFFIVNGDVWLSSVYTVIRHLVKSKTSSAQSFRYLLFFRQNGITLFKKKTRTKVTVLMS